MHGLLVIQGCQRSSCFKEADLRAALNLILWGWSCWTSLRGSMQRWGRLCFVVLSLFLLLLDLSFSHQPFSCSPPLFPLLYSKHSPPLSPSSWKVWFMDVWSMSAKNSHNTTSVIKPNIYIYSSFIPLFSPILSISSFFLCLCAADCRLNIGHAGVLLVERRGSYPLIDLRILKSKIKLKVYINWPCQQFCQSNNATRERCCVM